jgi:hypothetical protein
MRTPVAIIIFNRPDITERVVAEIARARPQKLLVIADGPRPEQAGEAEKCAAARAIVDRVDWECDVLKNYSDVNLGVGHRPATGIRWVFEKVEEAIILEDDCLAHRTFFPYCDELLEKYRDDERVMHISGDNWYFNQKQTAFSYFYSCYCYSCGWASWRRAFQHYDPEIKLWPTLRDTSWLLDILGDPRAVEFWKRKFDLTYTTGIQNVGWDWPWLFACWAQRGLSIIPNTNLISNIGFREDATHTKRSDDKRANVPTIEMAFPLNHPPCMVRDRGADQVIVEQVGLQPEPRDFYHKLRRKFAATLPDPLRKSISSLRSKFVSNITLTRD